MEFKNDISTKEDKDFIVDDGYNHDEDPTYEPKDSSSSDDDKYVTLHRNLMLKVKARARHACTTRLACGRSRICAY